ncbi:MAG: peptidoglycan DD-metalloendopeptidase family protein [Flavobacteriales bacterium]|nr:peptidoglycan DD-metalloendopeptidase family protein [Flavobacteriales bacterium]
MNQQTKIFRILSYLSIIVLLTVISIACENDTPQESVQVEHTPPPIPDPIMMYNLAVDSFIIDTGTVQQNQGLTHILPLYGITLAEIYTITSKYDSLFDVKKIKTDQPFLVLSKMKDDTLKRAEYFIYEINAIDYLVYHFGEDSLHAYIESKPVDVRVSQSGGVITSSLWNAFMDNDLPPALLVEYAKLYAWSVDFFGVQKGDYYKIIYEGKYVEEELVGIGNIHAVLFNHYDHDYYFFRYQASDTIEATFYTDSGESMQRALLSAPLEYTRISSKFSNNRFHPVLKIYRPHHGVDYAAPIGTEVVATGSGVVIYAGYAGGAGNMIKIQHDAGNILTKYLHLSKFGPGIKKGVHVLQGQKIGEVGSTGTSTGPHLDYRVYIDDQPVDPLSIDIPAGEPLSDSALLEYFKFIEPIKFSLDSIPAIIVQKQQIDEDSTVVE